MRDFAPTSSLPLFAASAGVRAKDPETSHEAAARATEKLRASQNAVLAAFQWQGEMTDEQLCRVYDRLARDCPTLFPLQTVSGLRTRRHELVLRELVVYSGKRDESVRARRVHPRIWRLASEAWK